MKSTAFIGQAMPRIKRNPHDWPSLNKWLYSIGLNDKLIRKHFLYSALVDYFPGAVNGSHKVPTEREINKEKRRLKKTLIKFKPEIVVPVGKLSISYCLNEGFGALSDVIGNTYHANPYSLLEHEVRVVPLPHPSGASTWRHKEENKKLLQKALGLLKKELEI